MRFELLETTLGDAQEMNVLTAHLSPGTFLYVHRNTRCSDANQTGHAEHQFLRKRPGHVIAFACQLHAQISITLNLGRC